MNTTTDWITAIAAIAAGGIALIALGISVWSISIAKRSAWSSERSAEEAAKQNHLALHQRQVDAYQAFQSNFEVWYDAEVKGDYKLLSQLSSACTIIKFLFKPEISNDVHEFFNLALILHDMDITQNLNNRKFEQGYSLDEGFRLSFQAHHEKLLKSNAQVVKLYRVCLKKIEEEISLHKE